MLNIWVTILVAFLSSFSALVATFLNNKSNEKKVRIQADLEREKNRESLRFSKCEQVYLSILKWQSNIFKTHMDWIMFVDGHIDRGELLKRADESNIKWEFLELRATLGVYFPNLLEDFDACKVELKPANKIYFAAQEGKELIRKEARNTILQCGTDFDKSVTLLLRKISSVSDFK